VTVTYGNLRASDAKALARIHRQAFPGFFLSSLGESFLSELYRGFAGDPSAITVVVRDAEGLACGAAVGSTEPAGFYRRLLKRRWPGFVAASVHAAIINPAAVPRLLRAILYRGELPSMDQWALLSSVCLGPALQGSGVGRQLATRWLEQAKMMGAIRVFLTTDADSNDAINRFYIAQGWTLAGDYVTPEDRPMNRYTIHLDGAGSMPADQAVEVDTQKPYKHAREDGLPITRSNQR
jgi:GNAT superfamily N-acetyltransferase